MPNQSKVQYLPTVADRSNSSYPDPSIVKLIHRQSNIDGPASNTDNRISQAPVDAIAVSDAPLCGVHKTQPQPEDVSNADSMQVDTSIIPAE